MIRTVILDKNQKPTKEQLKQIEDAAKREIVFDEDSTELTPEMEEAFLLFSWKMSFAKNIFHLRQYRIKIFSLNPFCLPCFSGIRLNSSNPMLV